jgi:hypothetical protein
MSKKDNVFEILNKVDVSEHMEKKGQFNYLSWAHAVRELLKVCPTATWEVHLFDRGDGTKQPYMNDSTGCYVQVSVDVDGIVRTQIHPVLDNRNQTIKTPNAFQVNTSIQRCLAKAIALHGLGLYLFAGEDLPEADELTDKQIETIIELASKLENDEQKQGIGDAVYGKQINSNNYEISINKINKMIKEQDNE